MKRGVFLVLKDFLTLQSVDDVERLVTQFIIVVDLLVNLVVVHQLSLDSGLVLTLQIRE